MFITGHFRKVNLSPSPSWGREHAVEYVSVAGGIYIHIRMYIKRTSKNKFYLCIDSDKNMCVYSKDIVAEVLHVWSYARESRNRYYIVYVLYIHTHMYIYIHILK